MKKLITIILILTAVNINAQEEKDTYFSVSAGLDIKNSTVGSKPTNNEPALNYTIDAHAVAENIDFNLGYECFDMIKYQRRYVALGYHFNVGYVPRTDIKFSIQPSLEFSNIARIWTDDGIYKRQSFSTPSININWNWDLNKHFAIQLATNILPRPDIRVLYNESNIRTRQNIGIGI